MSDSRVAAVTGGAQGIGAAICKELLKKGYRVCIADIQESKTEDFVKEQQLVYGEENVTSMRCDVSKESDYTNLFEETLRKFEKVDLLINNAGVILEQNPRKCLEVNLLGPIFGCYAALKYMGKSNGGKGGIVINTASAAAFGRHPEMPAYTASKSGVVALTRSLGAPFHYEKDGIIFAALCPFIADTDLLKTARLLDPNEDFTIRPNKLKPDFVAKGVLKILEDSINGSILIVYSDRYHYMEFQDLRR